MGGSIEAAQSHRDRRLIAFAVHDDDKTLTVGRDVEHGAERCIVRSRYQRLRSAELRARTRPRHRYGNDLAARSRRKRSHVRRLARSRRLYLTAFPDSKRRIVVSAMNGARASGRASGENHALASSIAPRTAPTITPSAGLVIGKVRFRPIQQGFHEFCTRWPRQYSFGDGSRRMPHS